MSSKVKRTGIAIAGIAALALGGGAIAGATGNGDDDAAETPITGRALERAKAAAVAHTGGGTVTGTEAGDEEGAYEVEVTRADGSQTDVHLDADFNVLGAEDDGSDDTGGTDD